MPIVRSIFFMAVSTAVRLGCGVLTFVVMARLLGPELFGTVMVWMSISFLLALFSTFGFAPYSLREIGATPDAAQDIMSEVLTAKLILTTIVLVSAGIALPFLQPSVRLVFPLLLAALLADSFTEFFNVGFRATNRYGTEAQIATVSALIQFSITTAIVWVSPTLTGAALALLTSRLCVLVITWLAQRRHFKTLNPSGMAAGFSRIRHAVSYAIDGGLQSLFGQIDSVVLNFHLGPSVVGVYQSGMRLFLGASQVATVLGNVFLPRAARVVSAPTEFRREAMLVQVSFIGTGLGIGLGFAAFANEITNLLFGEQYNSLSHLLPWFGLLFFIRFIAAASGIVLTAFGKQRFRARMNLIHWVLVITISAVSVPDLGALGWLIALILGNAALGVAYFAESMRILRGNTRSLLLTTAALLAVFGLSALIAYLYVPTVTNSVSTISVIHD